jgi:hypothetical protein
MRKPIFILVLLSPLFNLHSFARLQSIDTSIISSNDSTAIDVYHRFLSKERALYNGIEYIPYVSQLYKAHPYYLTEEFINGSIFYDGVLYKDIPLQFDIVKTALVIFDPYQKFKLQLANEKISWFIFDTTTFVHVYADPNDKTSIPTGFYHTLYNGKTSLIKKEGKTILEALGVRLERHVEESPVYYIKKDNKHYIVSGKAGVLSVFKDKKNEIRQFIRQSNLDFSEQQEHSLVSVVNYYNSITQ